MNRSSASASVWHITERSQTRAHGYLYYTWWDDSSTGAQPSPMGALRHRDAGQLPQETAHRCCCCLVTSWSWGSQTALHNLQNPRALSSHLDYCTCLSSSPLPPPSCEGSSHWSAVWPPPAPSVPRIPSTFQCRLARPLTLHQLF